MRRFQTLGELIGLYAQPNQGLVCALLLPVEREREPDLPDDRDASGAARVRCTNAFPAPIPGHYLRLPNPSSQPDSPEARCHSPWCLGPLPLSTQVSDSHRVPRTSLRAGGSHHCPLAPVHRWGG